MNRRFLSLFAVLLLSGCVSLPNVKVEDIDNRKVAYATKGEGTPVIVLVSGMGAAMSTWAPVFLSLTEVSTVFAYDRPRYGKSSQKQLPATAGELAEQLRQNLVSTGHAPPYLLAGHSAGGLYANVFARMYPNEVAGIVLIDATHPSQFEYFREHEPELYATFVSSTANGKLAYEASILMNINNEFKSLGPFPDVPLAILTAGNSSKHETSKFRKKWLEYQQDLANMSTGGTNKVIAGSGHFIHVDKPQAVINEIVRLNKLQ